LQHDYVIGKELRARLKNRTRGHTGVKLNDRRGIRHRSTAAIRGFRIAANAKPERPRMKKMIVTAVIATTLTPLGALAQERIGDAALGALSGAVVLGPVGAVAGAVVGYTTGPTIASSWGLRRHGRHYHRRYERGQE